MRTTIDKAGRVVIPAQLRERARCSAGAEAVLLLKEEVFSRMTVHDVPASDRMPMLQAAARDGTAGGRIYDAHIADVARSVHADVVVTDNRRHFVSALRHGMGVETPAEFLSGLKGKR